MLQEVTVPVSIVWGEEDPWEKVEWGRQLAKHASVQVGRGGVGAQRADCACAAGWDGVGARQLLHVRTCTA